MNLICKYLGGSHSYGLNTPESDIDFRGIFLNDKISTIIGLDRHEHQLTQTDSEDSVYMEFRNALKLLRTANTQMLECLYNDAWLEITNRWVEVQKYKARLVSSEKLFSCLRGYMQGELKLSNGERTGKLGSKRKNQIDTWGFSPKNFVNYFRLSYCGRMYFTNGYFPVNIMRDSEEFGNFLLDIKTNPQKYTKNQLNELAAKDEESLKYSYENRNYNTNFDEELANRLCLSAYKDILNNL